MTNGKTLASLMTLEITRNSLNKHNNDDHSSFVIGAVTMSIICL